VLIVAPGSLVEQWQDELREKFGLDFTVFSREQVDNSYSGNPFNDRDCLIARMDQLARSEDLQQKLQLSHWDLVVVDEAHKLSASYFGNKVKQTKRFDLGKLLGSITRHFLLMTATPHNGKDADFQLFMSLLDADRFYGKFRDGVHKVDVHDLMRRTVKEEMLRFDGSKLFPDRIATTASYTLSYREEALYTAVTNYVKNEMDRADHLGGQRKGNISFALTILQRRLASSPAAIHNSLKRRRDKLKRRIEEEKLRGQRQLAAADFVGDDVPDDIWEADDAMPATDYECFRDTILDQATASQTIQELEAEILILDDLESQARQLVQSGQDRKWEELSRLLQLPEMQEETGRQRKLIIFTEHRDTLDYLAGRIRDVIGGGQETVALIHGGIGREERRYVQELFRNDPNTLVLLATDAAGEGVNLQNANLMINYDLPWNPNRLEQRFGRIHRIGQTRTCHLWNMLAANTREGDVFRQLLAKLDIEYQALGGRVFDILGELFEEKSLTDLLIEAIRYGEDPERHRSVINTIDVAMDKAKIEEILKRDALCKKIMNDEWLFMVREEMEKAEARKLQPYFIRSFFNHAFEQFGGQLRQRETNRYEITHVPANRAQRQPCIAPL
jgi:SNF2 family DNA or RNA helicase